jgi:hypothetical protein
MKKFLLISLIGFALVGCGGKEVTEDMLIGDWECSGSSQYAIWENGEFQDYLPAVDSEKLLVKYFKEGDNFFVKKPHFEEKIPLDFKEMNGSYDKSYPELEISIVGFNKLEYISGDEFKSSFEGVLTGKELKHKTKILSHCTRMK